MPTTLLYLLPELPDRDDSATYWWLVGGDTVTARGADDAWRSTAADRTVALAPSGAVRIILSARAAGAASERQALTIARHSATEAGLGDPEAIHVVAATLDDSSVMAARVDNGVMLQWLDWSESARAKPDAIVPTGALLPLGAEWVRAQFGGDALVGNRSFVLPDEPDLTASIVGDAPVQALDEEALDRALVRAAAVPPPLDLRTGRFAPRRALVADRGRVRELLLLAAAIPLITLLWAIVAIVQLNRSTARIDAETVRVASAAAGRPVTAEEAETVLRQRTGGATSFSGPLAAVYRRIEGEPGVSATALAYRNDGTLTATLAAPTVGEVNRVLVGLQADAFRITAVPRQASDGRATVDVTVRSGA